MALAPIVVNDIYVRLVRLGGPVEALSEGIGLLPEDSPIEKALSDL